MKKMICILFFLCIILNQKMITQASDYQVNNTLTKSDLCYAGSSSNYDYDYGYSDILNDDDLENISETYSSTTNNQNNYSIITIFVIIGIYIIQGCVFGFATQSIIENKGYHDNWFWWGFFFGFIALLVALSKPELRNSNVAEQSILHNVAEEARDNYIMKEGGWECAFCHKKNDRVVFTCICGKSKDDTTEKIRQEKKVQMEQQQAAKNTSESYTIELLQQYKNLLDSGVLTQEEFDTKKKQLLEK